jgi:hypothetical protein
MYYLWGRGTNSYDSRFLIGNHGYEEEEMAQMFSSTEKLHLRVTTLKSTQSKIFKNIINKSRWNPQREFK